MTTAQQRRDTIGQMVEEQGRVTISELIEEFNVTDTSIRHDLTLLEDAGSLRRVRGGAVRASAGLNSVYVTQARSNAVEKQRIGRAAAEFISPGDVVLFDSGSTVAEVAGQVRAPLRAPSAITAVSHSQPVIQQVEEWLQPHLICLGGLFLPEHQASVGPMTLSNLRELTADIAFLGCDGLTLDLGLTTPHMLVAEVGAAIATRARRVIAVADATKLGSAGFTPIVALRAVDVLVTDSRADERLVAQIRRRGVEVVVV